MMARWVHHDAAALLLLVRGQSETPRTSRSFDFGRMTHDTTSQQQCIVPGTTEVLQSTAVVRRQQVVLAAIVPTDLVCTG